MRRPLAAGNYYLFYRMTDSLCRQPRFTYRRFKDGRFNLKHNAKNRSATNFTAYFDAATVLPDDVLRDPQSQPGTLLSGRKERIEDTCQFVFSNADATVAELHDN